MPGASRAYVRATLLCVLAWQAHMVHTLFRRGSVIPDLWKEWGGELPWVTQSFLHTYEFTPLLLVVSAALCADVLRRDPIPQKYAAWVFASVAIVSFVLEAWLTEAFFAPILRLANSGI